MAKVFISYCSKNSEFVDRLHGDLRKHGIETWLDKLDRQIDEEVYKLYGLTDEEIRTIEE